MLVLAWELDLMILEVFSNLNDSMILWFYENISEYIVTIYLNKAFWF